jgi:hypothetical protein
MLGMRCINDKVHCYITCAFPHLFQLFQSKYRDIQATVMVFCLGSCLAGWQSVCSVLCIDISKVCCNTVAMIVHAQFISANHCIFILVTSEL